MKHNIRPKDPTSIRRRDIFPVTKEREETESERKRRLQRPVQVHCYRRGQTVSCLKRGQKRVRKARITATGFVGAGKAVYLLDDGSWCFEHEVIDE
jgi:hypothetical protein